MERCGSCINFKYHKGHCRGSMDCDPDEWYCDADYDDILCTDDLEELFEYYAEEDEELQDFIDRFDCPGFCRVREDHGPDPDAWYDEMKERELLFEDEQKL